MKRKEAITLLKKLRTFHNGTYAKSIDMAIEALSADKVEVVRCKDCRWNTHYPFCDIDRNDDFFCADGEK